MANKKNDTSPEPEPKPRKWRFTEVQKATHPAVADVASGKADQPYHKLYAVNADGSRGAWAACRCANDADHDAAGPA